MNPRLAAWASRVRTMLRPVLSARSSHRGARTEPYVEILTREQLELVLDALQDALHRKPREVWPARHNVHNVDEQCVIVPLARLGVPEGRSGASVFIAYFVDRAADGYMPSRPLVVKLGERTKLEHELQRAQSWPAHPQGYDSGFAFPMHMFLMPGSATTTGSDCVLIAPFSSVDSLEPGRTSYDLEIRDLWRALVERSTKVDVKDVLWSVYDLMQGIHRAGRVHPQRGSLRYTDAYSKYLRDMHTVRRTMVQSLFGAGSSTFLLGRTWPNPLHLVDDLCDMPFDGVVGPIHGDLHPKNIVLDRFDRPRVIDFGWARDRAHVLIDYLLMEINLRAMTLPAQVAHDEVLALARMLAEADDAPTGTGPIAVRARWIREVLWHKARDARLIDDWTAEYLVPQFLIAFGLLKFLDDAKNQVALLCTVLCLAERIRTSWPRSAHRSVSR